MTLQQRRPVDLGSRTTKELVQDVLSEFTREDLLVGIPARVVNVDLYESQQVVDVKPVINDVYEDEDIVKSPILKCIFVKIPNGGGFSIKLPVSVGDLVTLHYAHRDISDWLDTDGTDINNPIGFTPELRDCWITHGFGTRFSHQSPSQTDFIISGANTTITITPSGEMSVVTTGSATLDAADYTIDCPVTMTETLVVQGNSLTVGGQEVFSHVHGGVTSGGSSTAPLT